MRRVLLQIDGFEFFLIKNGTPRMLSVDREDGNDRTARPSLFASITFIHMFISPFASQEMEDDGKWAWCLVPGACDLHQRLLSQICSNPDTLVVGGGRRAMCLLSLF